MPIPHDREYVDLVLAPGTEFELFIELVTGVGKGRDVFGDSESARTLRGLHPSPAILLHAHQTPKGGAANAPMTLDLVSYIEGGSVLVSFQSEIPDELAADVPEPWNKAMHDRLSDGALLSICEHDAGAIQSWMLPELPAWTEMFLPAFDAQGLIGAKRAMTITTSARTPMTLSVAVETSDPVALAPHGDRFMAEFLSRAQPFEDGRPASAFDFLGVRPEAIRTLARDPRENDQPAQLFGDGPDYAWCYRGERGKNEGRSWWIAGTDPAGVRMMSDRLTTPNPAAGDSRPWIVLAKIKPLALTRVLSGTFGRVLTIDPAIRGIFESAERIESMALSVYQDGPRTIKGRARFELVMTDGAPE